MLGLVSKPRVHPPKVAAPREEAPSALRSQPQRHPRCSRRTSTPALTYFKRTLKRGVARLAAVHDAAVSGEAAGAGAAARLLDDSYAAAQALTGPLGQRFGVAAAQEGLNQRRVRAVVGARPHLRASTDVLDLSAGLLSSGIDVQVPGVLSYK